MKLIPNRPTFIKDSPVLNALTTKGRAEADAAIQAGGESTNRRFPPISDVRRYTDRVKVLRAVARNTPTPPPVVGERANSQDAATNAFQEDVTDPNQASLVPATFQRGTGPNNATINPRDNHDEQPQMMRRRGAEEMLNIPDNEEDISEELPPYVESALPPGVTETIRPLDSDDESEEEGEIASSHITYNANASTEESTGSIEPSRSLGNSPPASTPATLAQHSTIELFDISEEESEHRPE